MANRSVWIVNSVGGLTVLTLLSVAGWYGWLNPDAAGPRLDATRAIVDRHEMQLARARGELIEQESVLERTRAEAESRGRLPETTGVEKDLGAIVALAQGHRITVMQVSPLPPQLYPGILEQRYSMDARGSYEDWIRFMQAFEKNEFWVDITHVRLATERAAGTEASAPRAQMILSFFSAVHESSHGART